MKKAFVLFLMLIFGLTAIVAVSGVGCGRVVDDTTTTTGGGGTTTTTAASGTTTTTTSSGTTTTVLLIKYPDESCYAVQTDQTHEHYAIDLLSIGWDGSGSNEAFLRFDLTTAGIPALTTIKSAILKIYITFGSTPTTNVYFYNLNNMWSQTSLTWLNKPLITGDAIATKTVNLLSDVDTLASIDITSLVQGWVTTSGYANFGIGIINPDKATTNLISIGSGYTTSPHKPVLEIRY